MHISGAQSSRSTLSVTLWTCFRVLQMEPNWYYTCTARIEHPAQPELTLGHENGPLRLV